MDNPKSRRELRDNLLTAAKSKFESICPENHKPFWELVTADIAYHAEKSAVNGQKYFSENEHVIGTLSLITSGQKHGQLLARVVQGSGLLLLSFLISWFAGSRLVSIIVSFLILLSLAGSLYLTYDAQAKRMQLELRQYGETWVRHSTALFEYEQELVQFVYDLDQYDAVPPHLQPKLFQSRVLQIRVRNQARFESNMSDLSGCVE